MGMAAIASYIKYGIFDPNPTNQSSCEKAISQFRQRKGDESLLVWSALLHPSLLHRLGGVRQSKSIQSHHFALQIVLALLISSIGYAKIPFFREVSAAERAIRANPRTFFFSCNTNHSKRAHASVFTSSRREALLKVIN